MAELLRKASKHVVDRLVHTRELGVIVPLVVIMVVTGAINPIFWSSANLFNVARDVSFLLILSLGVTLVMLGGGIDISVAMVATLSGVVTGYTMVNFEFPVPLAILAGLGTGLTCGFINGFVAARLGVPSIITTLGMMFAAMGTGLVITLGRPTFGFPDTFLFLGLGRIAGIPVTVLVALVLWFMMFVLVHRSRLGYWMAAIGGNEEAARRAGLNVLKLKWLAYIISSFYASISGILMSARLGVAQALIGWGMELRAIVATIIGGTSLFGGVATIPGTLAGATIMGMLTDILVLLHISAYWQDLAVGILIIAAVLFDTYRRRIRFIPEFAQRLVQSDVAVERPDLALVFKGAGLSTDTLASGSKNHEPILKMRGITKYFGYVHALDKVDFDIYPGEVMALVGDNGAGKSTLVKIASGSLELDEGKVFMDGERVVFEGPRDAASRGIAMLYQDLSLVECRDVAANLFLGREPTWWRWLVDRKRMFEGSQMMQEGVRMKIPSPKTTVQFLSGGQRQGVAVARAVSQGASILILDEPTAALGVQEAAQVEALIEELRAAGCAIVVISHNLFHVFSVADRITVLRGGRNAGTWQKKDTNADEIVAAITGAKILKSTR